MLKLERLELSGFKSFVDPVGLDFSGRMTSIVGPNGCGKSNLADAVVWVLGERSAKTLRGDTMEDVIFSGSSNRKPLGMAEVQLTFSADGDFEGADDHRLVIGRRLYRDGQSQYLINGKRSRLKDVRDTLMDTGLGIRAYSVIEQGKIGLILSGKPQERRRLLEEAAGITRYKERRRIAEVKLEEARDNLSRLDDIISEVERALRSLKRQASAARRLEARREEYRDLLRQVLMARWSVLFERQARLQEQLAQATTHESKLNAALHSEEAELAEGRETLDELSRHLAEQHRSDSELAARIEGKQEFLKGSRHRLDELVERVQAGVGQKAAREGLVVDLGERLVGIGSRIAELTEERDGAASVVDEDDQKIQAVQQSVTDAEKLLESYRARLLTSVGEVSGTRNRLHQQQLEREKGELRRRHLEEELSKKGTDLDEALDETRAAEATAKRLNDREQAFAKSCEALEARRDETMQREREVTDQIEALDSRVDELERRAELLEELARAQEARRREVREALGETGLDSLTFLAEALSVPKGWERSLDLYLGELADAVILPQGESRLGVAKALAESRGTFRLLASAEATHREGLTDPAIRSSLADAVGLADGLARALPPAYLVESAEDAERLAASHPGIAFISKDRFWAQSGIVHVQGREASPGELSREQELARLREQVPPLEEDLASTRALQAKIVETLDGLRRELEIESARLTEVRQEFAIAQARHEDAVARESRLKVEHEALDSERSEIVSEIGVLAERADGLASELGTAEENHATLERAFDEAQKSVDRAREDRESVRTSGADRRGRLELVEARLDAHRAESARIEAEITDGKRQIEEWRLESERLTTRQEELGAAMSSAETELQTALEQRQSLLDRILAEQGAVDEKRGVLKAAEEGIEAARKTRDEVHDGISELRVEQATLDQEVEHLSGSYREEFEEELPETPPTDESVKPLPELETDLERCRTTLERIGPVNLLAAQEYDEQAERHEYLTTQRTDVADSVTSLQRTIREINATSSERFLAAFEEINEHFGKTFVDLFRGGAAEMRLMDEDDPLETGIEIVARPPGKRLQNIMLMSGGEKALTAIALLFALFHTKPSPFCILDEVDAPLDDVNTMRFVELLKTRSAHTQFIVVTHNKITMEAASMLYGVTMQERGVSNLVSVELDEVAPAEQAATA